MGMGVGAIAGHRMDMGRRYGGGWVIEISQEIIEISRKFFQEFIGIFLAVTDEIRAEPA
jgi:hypothetical protein